MAIDRRPITIHYRRFNRDTGNYPSHSLEEMICYAMEAVKDGSKLRDKFPLRVQKVGDDNYFINTYLDTSSDGTSLVFGDIIHFTNGHLQALFSLGKQDAPSAPVRQMPAPALNEYVHSQLFWMAKGDHVFVVQSTSLRTEDLERYLQWLLGLSAQSPVVLTAKFDEAAVGGDLGDIQEIVIGGIATAPPVEQPPIPPVASETVREITQHGDVGASKQTGWAQAIDVLKTLLGSDANVEQVMKSVPSDADLHVAVHIGYKTRKRQVSRTALKSLETGLRNVPDSQLKVRAKGSSRTSDGSVRLHHNANIRLIKALDGEVEKIGSLLDPADVLRAMYEAYNLFLANGKITN